MKDVVALLEKAQTDSPADQRKDFEQARAKIREVVTKLSIERQNLSRRLKVAELAAQVKRLIEMETAVNKTTDSLPSLPARKQTEVTLTTVQDQQDVKTLFIHLVNSLADVSQWGGTVVLRGRWLADRQSRPGGQGTRQRQSLARTAGFL